MMLLLLAASIALASASATSFPHDRDAQVQSSGTCPDKWVDATFVNMGYLYFNTTEPMTWDRASSMCQMGWNSTLLEIRSEMQMAFIQMELSVIEDHEDANFQWWTAATDVGINGQWIWITSLTPVEDYFWYAGYPNGWGAENCANLHVSSSYLGYNLACDNLFYPICQLK